MKYTTKSGKDLPHEVVEVIEQEQARQRKIGILVDNTFDWGLDWLQLGKLEVPFINISHHDNFTEFYKLYPKKDLDSYGNEIVKGEMVHAADHENMLGLRKYEFYGIATKADNKYLAYTRDMVNCCTFKFCRKINTNASKKSELESQMNDLLTKANELKQKINEL